MVSRGDRRDKLRRPAGVMTTGSAGWRHGDGCTASNLMGIPLGGFGEGGGCCEFANWVQVAQKKIKMLHFLEDELNTKPPNP